MQSRLAYLLAAVALAVAAAAFVQTYYAVQAVNDKLAQLQSRVEAVGAEVSRGLAGVEAKLSSINSTAAAAYREAKLLREISGRPSGFVPVRYARLFSIQYEGDVYILRDALGRRILLLPRGMSQDLANYYRAKYRPDAVVYYPVKRAVYMSSTEVAMAYRLYKEAGRADVLRSIVGIMWGREYRWYLPEVEAMLNNGTIADVGPAYSPDFEKIASLKPDVVFVFYYPGPYGTESVVKKLDQLGIPYAVVNEFQEQTALGRAEWIKFIAAFYNATDDAVKIFDRVEARWSSLASLVADLDRPRVAWFTIFGGVLYPAGAGVRDLIRTAGGRYAYANYSRVDLEVVLKHKNDVDVLIWSSYGVSSVRDLLKVEPRLAELRPVVLGRVYAYSPAFYQLANAYPERLLEELVWIIHPEVAPPGNFTLFVHLQ
ncbi:ABC transporter substrate-binding protein [Pyrobaculum neutrophilum]|uniref:Periplasmic binding protein n=1 Tax=Pyrobaculum neutrophilum (strain DSM 2338 / JCM 9278 / NBRC 100436 / V24Sta) TaxID=444157 RepID=B1YE11_PYRNV|nr:ABC transporter substrate-binding protein [Pyrobaculum neutrophilum]ACB40024.1 periplasmic binding protein [Pyrobaculum neutrophilum V24Sta]